MVFELRKYKYQVQLCHFMKFTLPIYVYIAKVKKHEVVIHYLNIVNNYIIPTGNTICMKKGKNYFNPLQSFVTFSKQ